MDFNDIYDFFSTLVDQEIVTIEDEDSLVEMIEEFLEQNNSYKFEKIVQQ